MDPSGSLDSPWVIAALYAGAALLAGFAAASELAGRFRDEPFRVLGGVPALSYLTVNAGLAAAVLLGLRFASEPNTTTLALEQVVLAGFGARIIIRTKVIGVRGDEEIGPGAIFDRLLATISRQADRDRATQRLDLVSSLLRGISWDSARPMFVAEVASAMQDLSEEEKEEIAENVRLISDNPELDEPTRLDSLGYLVLRYAGEDFLNKLTILYWERAENHAGKSLRPKGKSLRPKGKS